MSKKYSLPSLPYSYNALDPVVSEELLTIHHTKHHAAYIDSANEILERLEKTRSENSDLDLESTLKSLSFNINGHILHSLFWKNLKSPEGNNEPRGDLAEKINGEFHSFERLKEEFSETARSVEGSGWVALVLDNETSRLILSQIEKHNANTLPFKILLVLDVWEHAFYLDYKNEKKKFIDEFWKIVNWEEVEKRLND